MAGSDGGLVSCISFVVHGLVDRPCGRASARGTYRLVVAMCLRSMAKQPPAVKPWLVLLVGDSGREKWARERHDDPPVYRGSVWCKEASGDPRGASESRVQVVGEVESSRPLPPA